MGTETDAEAEDVDEELDLCWLDCPQVLGAHTDRWKTLNVTLVSKYCLISVCNAYHRPDTLQWYSSEMSSP